MDSWEGIFSWQGYALEGRPDLLNYIRCGDVGWPDIWSFYGRSAASTEAVQRVSGLFHASLSQAYDREGSVLDLDGETYRQLRAWSEFAVAREDLIPEASVQEVLTRLADMGLVSELYYTAAYSVYMETTLDRYAAGWRSEVHRWSDTRSPAGKAGEDRRRLGVYYPEAERFPTLRGDPEWEQSLRRFLDNHYDSWNRAFSAAYAGAEEPDPLEVGGEG